MEAHNKQKKLEEHQFDEKEVSQLKILLKYVDRGDTGAVSKEQFLTMLRLVDLDLPPAEVAFVWQRLVKNGENFIDHHTVVDFVTQRRAIKGFRFEEVEGAFKVPLEAVKLHPFLF